MLELWCLITCTKHTFVFSSWIMIGVYVYHTTTKETLTLLNKFYVQNNYLLKLLEKNSY